MLGRALTFWLAGVDARLIEVEAATRQGATSVTIVGPQPLPRVIGVGPTASGECAPTTSGGHGTTTT